MQKKSLSSAAFIIFFMILSFNSLAQKSSPWKKGDLTHMNSYFDKYCYSCHGVDSRERGGIELESMKFDLGNRKNLYFWSRVHEVIKTGEMPPPKKKKQPSKTERKKTLSILGENLYKSDARTERQMEKRLSNKAIENVLIDVLGTYLDSDNHFGNAEGSSGFDNQYTDLKISSSFMISYNKYINAALEDFFSPEKSTSYKRSNVYIEKNNFIKKNANRVIKKGGKYRLSINFKDFPELDNHQAYIRIESRSMELGHPKMIDLSETRELTLDTVLYPGSRFQIVSTLSAKNKRFSDLRKLKNLTLEGPLEQYNIFTQLSSCANVKNMTVENGSKLLINVLPLLYGRPALTEIKAYEAEVKKGQSPLLAAKKTLKKALLSAEFLFGVDLRAGKKASDTAIAKRMARVLWRSIPDRELLDLALKKKLSDPKVRRKQALRMMKDSRFQRFKKDFFASWLGSKHFYSKANPTKDYFSKFYQQGEVSVLYSLYEQQYLYLNDIMDNNRSIVDLVSSNWTYANDLIGKNYGLGVKGLGKNLTRIKLPKNSLRGGILTQCSIYSDIQLAS
ncbi:MAG: DUF1592 domain-containing protein [Lentisphaeraceae bacterium]|nr:DUF1592 domain-containing protein [Lentisphaeraceae bacterium]